MDWIIGYFISIFIFVLSFFVMGIVSKVKTRKVFFLSPSNIMMIGVLLSASVMFFPIYFNLFSFKDDAVIKTVLLSFHNSMRLFVIDGEFGMIAENLVGIPEWLSTLYFVHAGVLYIIAPVLTLGVVLSFFKNISAYKEYMFKFNSPVYVFSELNEKSCALGKSIKNDIKNAVIVYTNKTNDQGTTQNLLVPEKSVIFNMDISSVKFSFHNPKSEIVFFSISDNEDENIESSLRLTEKYKMRENTKLYVFSTKPEAETIFSKVDNNKLKIRRVNPIQSFIFNDLYENGYPKLFESAEKNAGADSVRKISAIVIGMNNTGIEMTKTLAWFCQMDGYQVEINSFSSEKNARSKFELLCPELMDEDHNGKFDDIGESQYKITIHDGIDYSSKEFNDKISRITDATYVFVTLEDDQSNIKKAIELRQLFEREKKHPVIRAVLADSKIKNALKETTNFSGQEYDVEFVGDTDSLYSNKVILNAELEKEALKRHLRWGNEEDFWRYEYNHKSSLASALHRKMKLLCKIPGIDLLPKDRSENEKNAIRMMEHRRWNAYMRSEGFVYSGSCEKSSRNNLAKMHNCLVPFDKLSIEEKEKDDN